VTIGRWTNFSVDRARTQKEHFVRAMFFRVAHGRFGLQEGKMALRDLTCTGLARAKLPITALAVLACATGCTCGSSSKGARVDAGPSIGGSEDHGGSVAAGGATSAATGGTTGAATGGAADGDGGNGGASTAIRSGSGGAAALDAALGPDMGRSDVSQSVDQASGGDLTVAQVLDRAGTLMDTPLTVVGKVFEDVRSKMSDWPAPAASAFILQDGGEAPAYGGGSSAIAYIQLYWTTDLAPYLRRNVRVHATLRRVLVEYPGGQSENLMYLDVSGLEAM